MCGVEIVKIKELSMVHKTFLFRLGTIVCLLWTALIFFVLVFFQIETTRRFILNLAILFDNGFNMTKRLKHINSKVPRVLKTVKFFSFTIYFFLFKFYLLAYFDDGLCSATLFEGLRMRLPFYR